MNDMRQGNCALCGHDEVIEARPKEFSGEVDQHARPLALAHGTTKPLLSAERPDPDRAIGVLTAYTCRSCGFVQWFASRPVKIPIDDVDTKLIKGAPPPAAPYC